MKYLLRFVGVLLLLLLLVAMVSIRRVDRTPYNETAFYQSMMQRLDSFSKLQPPAMPDTTLMAGWAKVNITPPFAVPTAGYAKRNGQSIARIHDSLFVSATWLQWGSVKAVIVSCDLLIIPPEVTLKLKAAIGAAGISWNELYIGATHTHNSFGGWGKRYIGELFAGKYNEELVNNLAAQIIQAIHLAGKKIQPVHANYMVASKPELVMNRVLGEQAKEDPLLQQIIFETANGAKSGLSFFAAHATTLSDTVLALSADYPGAFNAAMQQKNKLQQSTYMAAAVGSMGPSEVSGNDWAQMNALAVALATIDTSQTQAVAPYLHMATLPLSMREPQWRFAKNWCFRHWLWSRLYGDYDMEVKALRLGNVLLVGMPCDFGGELMQPLRDYAASKGRQLIVTSFNGGYAGYITPDERYDAEGYETRIMNWFGPGNAAYFSEVIKRLVDTM